MEPALASLISPRCFQLSLQRVRTDGYANTRRVREYTLSTRIHAEYSLNTRILAEYASTR